MQTGPAIRDSFLTLSDAAVFVAVQWISAVVLFWAADPRLVIPLLAWFIAYGVALSRFVPLIRTRSTEASDARSMLLGRIVDSYTNILTVKLFAHAENEESYARAALQEQTGKYQSYVRLTTVMTATLSALNGLVIAGTMALAIWLWSNDIVSLGAVALVATLVMRITQMSGWVLNLVTTSLKISAWCRTGWGPSRGHMRSSTGRKQSRLPSPRAKSGSKTSASITAASEARLAPTRRASSTAFR
jgi:ATP-binding cassette subfamily B multidrug efflux pump